MGEESKSHKLSELPRTIALSVGKLRPSVQFCLKFGGLQSGRLLVSWQLHALDLFCSLGSFSDVMCAAHLRPLPVFFITQYSDSLNILN